MIDRQYGLVVIECDGCGADLPTEKSNFPEAMEVMREKDWKSEKVGPGWAHWCPECKK